MVKFRYIAPYNQTGYGRAAIAYALGLLAHGFKDFTYHVIGTPQLDMPEFQSDLCKELVSNHLKSDPGSGPAFVFWHLGHIDQLIDQFNIDPSQSIAFSTFEIDSLKEKEYVNATMFKKVGTANQYHTNILREKYNLNTTVPIPHISILENAAMNSKGEDYTNQWNKYIDLLSLYNPDYFNVGKFETRKSSIEILEAVDRYASINGSTTLVTSWYNPFIPDGYPYYLFTNGKYKFNKLEHGVTLYTNVRGDLRVLMLPYVAHNGLLPQLAQDLSSVGIFASKAEGFNLPLYEFALHHVNCVYTKIPVHEEYMNSDIAIETPTMERAYDGKFFHGEGNWHTVTATMIHAGLNRAAEELEEGNEISYLKNTYSWQKVSNLIINEMMQII